MYKNERDVIFIQYGKQKPIRCGAESIRACTTRRWTATRNETVLIKDYERSDFFMRDRTLDILHESDKPLSTNEVAEQLGVDWHTAKKHLGKLVKQNKVHRSEVSNRLTLYWDEEIPF